MEFEILSHAGLRIEHGGSTLIVDPWLIGSAYWRSWWNYPPLDHARVQSLKADFIYLSHIHWDHFHGPSLRMLGKDVQVLLPEDRYSRMRDDLRAMGFKRVLELPHGKSFKLSADFAITPFLFFPLTDSMLAVRAGNTVLLDANDCKICGLPLRHVKRQFPSIDFVLRSHSSANTRVCHEYLDGDNSNYDGVDDKEGYLRSFANFMSAVKPRYAVPFASNHCHLHREARRFNRWQQTPKDVQDYFRRYKAETGTATELVSMLPGSVWNDRTGFALASEAQWFSDRERQIEAYAEANAQTLAGHYALEDKAVVSEADLGKYFSRLHSHMPWFWLRRFAGRPVYFNSRSGDRSDLWKIDVHADRVTRVAREEYLASDMRIEMPAIMLKQALRMNMFGQTGISKRVKWVMTRQSAGLLGFFMLMLDFEEYELIPLRRNLSWRSLRVWARRWREVLGYAQLTWIMKSRKIAGREVEQVALLEYS
ncbi:MAG: MBL fold metallo-hydrolase [Steroidobacteraceae bacterium]